jgi:hypothetical protein
MVEDESTKAFNYVSVQIRLEESALAVSEPLVAFMLRLFWDDAIDNNSRAVADWFLSLLYGESNILKDLVDTYQKLSQPAVTGKTSDASDTSTSSN